MCVHNHGKILINVLEQCRSRGGALPNDGNNGDTRRIIHVGNVYCKPTHGGVAGDIFSTRGIAPTLCISASTRVPYIIIGYTENGTNRARARSQTPQDDNGAKFSAAKQLTPRIDGISNTITSCLKDNLLLLAYKAGDK